MQRTFCHRLLLVGALSSLALTTYAQNVQRTPLSSGHPLIGSWRIDVPGTNCHEIYNVSANGTMKVSSGVQAAEPEFEISAVPSQKGFYRWIDKITKDNGKPDCSGSIMEVGHVATNFIIVHPSKREFLMCEAEDIKTCIGPFKKLEGT